MSEAVKLIAELCRRGLTVAVAESCTGGLLAAALTDVAGSSQVFGWGLVTYSNQAKTRLLGVSTDTLDRWGAVSSQTAGEMVSGLLKLSGADLALATTGIAGPDGGSAEKPVGLVYIACGDSRGTRIVRRVFAGERGEVRRQSVQQALLLVEQYLEDNR